MLCLEQWALGHGRGASEDHSRIIRMGYHAAAYTALVRESYEAWAVAERESGVPLVLRTGMLNLARPRTEGAEVLDNYAASMAAFGIEFEQLGATDVRRRWPQFRLDDDHRAVWQRDGGILDIRRGVAVQLALARRNGATVLADAGVTAISEIGDHLELHTAAGDFEVEQVVVCAGAWTARLLETQLDVRWPIRLTREQVTYFATSNLRSSYPTGSRSSSPTTRTTTTASRSTARSRRRRPPRISATRSGWRTELGAGRGPRAPGGRPRRGATARVHRTRALHPVLPVRHAAGP